MMKKLTALVLALAMMLCACAGLAQDVPEETTFYLATMTLDGQTYSAADFGLEMVLVLYSDGTGYMGTADSQEALTWETAEDGVLNLTQGDETISCTVTEEGIEAADGETSMFFSLEQPEALNLGEILPAAVVTDFNGTWDCAYLGMEGMTVPADTVDAETATTLFGTEKLTVVIEDGNVSLGGSEAMVFSFADGVLDFSIEGNDLSHQTIALTDAGCLAYTILDAMTLYCLPAAE